MHEIAVESVGDGVILLPDRAPRASVIVVAGSSGRLDLGRARLFTSIGCAALTFRYFGGPQQSPGICEIPLEGFSTAADLLAEYAPSRLVMVGTSKGAEACLAFAVRDPRVELVAAFAPSSVVWANLGPGLDGLDRPQRSCWTWRGEPLPFVRYDDDWPVPPEPVAFRPMYERSLALDPAGAERASIRIEEGGFHAVLVAGADDELWPSDVFAEQLAARRDGRGVDVLIGRDAGHHACLPGEGPIDPPPHMHRGGSPEADAALGARAWEWIRERLA